MIQATPAYGASIYSAVSIQSGKSASSGNAEENSAGRPSQQNPVNDTVTISRQGIQQASTVSQSDQQTADSKKQNSTEPKGQDGEILTDQEQQKLQKLKLRDAEVKAHEQAHLSTAGQYAAGGASFSFETGPDGAKYAIGGEVPIDMSKEDTPEATIMKMQTVRRAALAPADPSSADRRIAAQAGQKAAQARQEIMRDQNSSAQDLFAESSSIPLDGLSEKNGQNETKPESVEGSSRQILAINTYKQIASMMQ